MSAGNIYISIALEQDQDWPVADIIFRGVQWASVTLHDGQLKVSVYGQPGSGWQIPIDDAIASLVQAKQQLQELLGKDAPDPIEPPPV